MTDPAGKDEKLMDCLRTLFPECDIETHPGRPETFGAICSAEEKTAAQKKETEMEVMMNKILVVDNDEMIRMRYSDEFEEEGYDVLSIGDCTRALKVIEKERPDVIVMETKLGEHNGLDLLQNIREMDHNPPVILCTAYLADKYDPKSTFADSFVLKSLRLKNLKQMVKLVFQAIDPFNGGTAKWHQIFESPNIRTAKVCT